jgi:hypothetical protein
MAETQSESYFTCPKCGGQDYTVSLTRNEYYAFRGGRLVEFEDDFPGCGFMRIECDGCHADREESLNYDQMQAFLHHADIVNDTTDKYELTLTPRHDIWKGAVTHHDLTEKEVIERIGLSSQEWEECRKDGYHADSLYTYEWRKSMRR